MWEWVDGRMETVVVRALRWEHWPSGMGPSGKYPGMVIESLGLDVREERLKHLSSWVFMT